MKVERMMAEVNVTGTAASSADDLYRIRAKAELVDGQLRIMEPTGLWPGRAAGSIYASLLAHQRRTRSGYAVPDNVGFLVDLPNRKSFSPDAAYFTGVDSGMKFARGAPIFAVEVRCENDYGPPAEFEMRQKRADYFAAGTQVLWDVSLETEVVIRSFRNGDPDQPAFIYRHGEIAEAEPAVPGWRFAVNEPFD